MIQKLRKVFNFLFKLFRFKDEDEALVVGFAGTEAFFGMYEAVEILRRDRERMKRQIKQKK